MKYQRIITEKLILSDWNDHQVFFRSLVEGLSHQEQVKLALFYVDLCEFKSEKRITDTISVVKNLVKNHQCLTLDQIRLNATNAADFANNTVTDGDINTSRFATFARVAWAVTYLAYAVQFVVDTSDHVITSVLNSISTMLRAYPEFLETVILYLDVSLNSKQYLTPTPILLSFVTKDIDSLEGVDLNMILDHINEEFGYDFTELTVHPRIFGEFVRRQLV